MNCYLALVLGGIIVGIIDDPYSQICLPAVTMGNVAILLRLRPLNVNKYMVWTMLGGILHIIHVTGYVEVENNLFLAATLTTTFVSVTIMSLWLNRLEVAGLLDWIKKKFLEPKEFEHDEVDIQERQILNLERYNSNQNSYCTANNIDLAIILSCLTTSGIKACN